jgi:hypothetical protein
MIFFNDKEITKEEFESMFDSEDHDELFKSFMKCISIEEEDSLLEIHDVKFVHEDNLIEFTNILRNHSGFYRVQFVNCIFDHCDLHGMIGRGQFAIDCKYDHCKVPDFMARQKAFINGCVSNEEE